jgi:hypothetical protein
MPVFLDEESVGHDPATIGFPHLLLCMGFVVVTANELWGVHLTSVDTSQAMLGRFWVWAQAKGLAAASITHIYGCCNRLIRYGVTNPAEGLTQWTVEMGILAGLLGWNGPAHGFDTSIINPLDGTFVRYDRAIGGTQPCTILYKRNEKTHETGYTNVLNTSGGESVAEWSNYINAWKPIALTKTDVAINRTFWNKGLMHELDYALRLQTINV